MSDSRQTDSDPPSVDPKPAEDVAPKIEPPRVELLPYAMAKRGRRGFPKGLALGSSLAAALALVAGVAAAGLYDHAKQANLLAARVQRRRA